MPRFELPTENSVMRVTKEMPKRASQIRCPKCHKKGMTCFLEIWSQGDSSIGFSVEDGVMVHQMHNPPEINPTAVEACCDCGHHWRLRGVSQITNIDAD